jgi:large subunit ribosomal protein L4
VFGSPWNPDLVHDVVVSMQSNARANTAHTKMRGEVSGGGKKPWRQKGTGRARHGSTRSPIWRGGGVTFGPRNDRNYTRKINKNARAKALACVLSQKLADGEMVFVDSISFEKPKTADARAFVDIIAKVEGVESVGTKKANAAIVLLTERDENAELSFRNFGNIQITNVKDVNPVDLLTYKYVIVAKPEDALKVLESRVSTKVARKAMAVKK